MGGGGGWVPPGSYLSSFQQLSGTLSTSHLVNSQCTQRTFSLHPGPGDRTWWWTVCYQSIFATCANRSRILQSNLLIRPRRHSIPGVNLNCHPLFEGRSSTHPLRSPDHSELRSRLVCLGDQFGKYRLAYNLRPWFLCSCEELGKKEKK